MKKAHFKVLMLAMLGIFATQCRKDSSKNYIKLGGLTSLPIAMNEFTSLVPLGFVSPPAHVFPNDHMGFYYVEDNHNVIIRSPGNIRLFEIRSNTYNPGQPNETGDYALSFGVNGESTLIFGHISKLSPKLMSILGNSSSGCEEYPVGSGIVKACRKSVSVNLTAGEIIGYSNMVLGQYAMDMGMYVNNKPVSPLDYFDPAVRTQLETRLLGAPNAYNEGLLRTAQPLGGEVDQDILGTLQGIWLQKGFSKYPENNHIAFVKDYIFPEQLRISLGSALPVFSPGLWKFDQQSAGVINRAFVDVKNDGKTYCYDPLYLSYDPAYPSQGTFPNNSIIVKLVDTKTINLEVRDCNCSQQIPYVFTNDKITYVRD